jgi:hypothetical protein
VLAQEPFGDVYDAARVARLAQRFERFLAAYEAASIRPRRSRRPDHWRIFPGAIIVGIPAKGASVSTSEPTISLVPGPNGDITVCFGARCITVKCAGPVKKTNPPHAISMRLVADEQALADYIFDSPDEDPVIIGVLPDDIVQLDDMSAALGEAQMAGREVTLWVTPDA